MTTLHPEEPMTATPTPANTNGCNVDHPAIAVIETWLDDGFTPLGDVGGLADRACAEMGLSAYSFDGTSEHEAMSLLASNTIADGDL